MDGAGAPSGATMVDAQFTTAKVYKPFEGFEKVYQGRNGQVPIAIPALFDKRAGTPGFDPNFMVGIPMPEGARVLLWLPMCFTAEDELQPFRAYTYRFAWRYSTLGDYRAPAQKNRIGGSRRLPFHFPKQSPGAADTSSGIAVPRETFAAAWNTIAYEQAEPVIGAGESTLRIEGITPELDSLLDVIQPLLPNGQPGVIQQGVFDPGTSGGAAMPAFMPFMMDAMGDQLFILVKRKDPTANWDFTDPALDLAFSNVYGTGNGTHPIFRDVGIYVQTGTTP